VVKMKAFVTLPWRRTLVNQPRLSPALKLCFVLQLSYLLSGYARSEEAKVAVSQVSDGVLVKTVHDQLHVAVCGPSMVHVTAGPENPKPSSPQQPWILANCGASQFTLSQSDKFYLLTTDTLQIKISLDTGGVLFSDKAGNALLTEGVWG